MSDAEIYKALKKYIIEDDFDFYADFLNTLRFVGAKTKSDVLVAAIKMYNEIKGNKSYEEKFWNCMKHMHLYDMSKQMFYGVKPKDVLHRYSRLKNFEKEKLVNFFTEAVSRELAPMMITSKMEKL